MTDDRIHSEMEEELRTDTLAEILKAMWVLEAQIEYLQEQKEKAQGQVDELEEIWKR